jgi:hypothetical protein
MAAEFAYKASTTQFITQFNILLNYEDTIQHQMKIPHKQKQCSA